MIIKYTDSQMLDIWRLAANIEPTLSDASIERFDSIDIDRRLRIAMRGWYIDYLTNAEADILPVADLTNYARCTEGSVSGHWTVRMSCEIGRITSLELNGTGIVPLLNPSKPENADVCRRLSNRMARYGNMAVAFYTPGTDYINLYVKPSVVPEIKAVYGTMVTDDETYTVDERTVARIFADGVALKALNTLPL